MRVFEPRRLVALAVAAVAIAIAPAELAARRGPGGVVGVGAVAGSPTALELVVIPRAIVSFELKVGLAGFASESYGEIGVQLHGPELIRRPLWSARVSIGAGAYGLTEEVASFAGTPGEIGVVANPNLAIEMSAFPVELVIDVPVRFPAIELEARELHIRVGVSGGLRYYF